MSLGGQDTRIVELGHCCSLNLSFFFHDLGISNSLAATFGTSSIIFLTVIETGNSASIQK